MSYDPERKKTSLSPLPPVKGGEDQWKCQNPLNGAATSGNLREIVSSKNPSSISARSNASHSGNVFDVSEWMSRLHFECPDTKSKALDWRKESGGQSMYRPSNPGKEDVHFRENDSVSHLKIFNNWAKSCLMLQGIPKGVRSPLLGLDLGCRHGGDLIKWFHCRVEHLYLVEDNFDSMYECRRRYFSMRSWNNFYSASFIQENFATGPLEIPKVVDMVSSQMAIHKAFETKTMAEQMAENVSRSLKCGGTFVVSLTNASMIIDSLHQTPGGKLVGNSVYQVQVSKRLPKTENIPEFGVQFQFIVGHSIFKEYLVQLPVLEKVMAKQGLVLERNVSFLEMYYEERKKPEQLPCLQKMGVVRRGYNQSDKKNVYLTMSAEEREVAALFQALTFKKVFK